MMAKTTSRFFPLCVFVCLLAAFCPAPAGAQVHPDAFAVFQSLTVEKSAHRTDDVDLQTAVLTVTEPVSGAITDLKVRVRNGQNETRGHFQWTPSGGFKELGSAATGMTLLKGGSVEREGTKVVFRFHWTASPLYGETSDNDVSYWWSEPVNGRIVDWSRVDTDFSTVFVPSEFSSFKSLSVEKQQLLSDAKDVQRAFFTLNVGPQSRLDDVRIRVRTSSGDLRGQFQWTPAGFRELGTSGNSYVTLLADQCAWTADPESATVTYTFAWTANPDYGQFIDNDVSYWWGESANSHSVGWGKVETNFSVTAAGPAPFLNHVLLTGQSLSVGFGGSPVLSTAQPYTNLTLASGVLAPLVETTQETIRSGMANALTALDPDQKYQSLMTSHGASSQGYATLKKGTTLYNRSLTQISQARTAAAAMNRPHRVTALAVIHGETDHVNGNAPYYEDYLTEWQRDYETDIRTLTGQTEAVPMFTDQFSAWTRYTTTTSEIPIAQLAAAENNPGKIHLVGPKYFLPYSDGVHLNNEGYRWLGEYYAKAYRKVVIEKEDWVPLSPRSITRVENRITVTFNVPEPPLAIDTERMAPKANYGFEYYDEGGNTVAITQVRITGPDTVEITLNAVPTGDNQRLRYAYTGIRLPAGALSGYNSALAPGGNLRDSDPTPSQYTPVNYPFPYTLYNWAVIFDKPVEILH